MNNHIYQAILSEVGQGFLSILDDGDQVLYLGLAFLIKTKVSLSMKVDQYTKFPTIKPIVILSN